MGIIFYFHTNVYCMKYLFISYWYLRVIGFSPECSFLAEKIELGMVNNTKNTIIYLRSVKKGPMNFIETLRPFRDKLAFLGYAYINDPSLLTLQKPA